MEQVCPFGTPAPYIDKEETNMNKDQFWQMIDTANQSASDKDRKTYLHQMESKLAECSLDDIVDWHLIFCQYSKAAYRNDLWAASAALGAHYTDDGFTDFRSWLISRGKEVYMNAMRNPDSLATVPRKDEDLNFEEFGYAADRAYDMKLSHEKPSNGVGLFEVLNAHTIPAETAEAISEELPKRPDINVDWSLWQLSELFPNISKARMPKDIEGLMATGNIVYAYVYKDGKRTQYVFHYTPENIANFLGSRPDVEEIIVTDIMDELVLKTFGNFIDKCPDKDLLESVKRALVPIQAGKAKAQSVFCPLYDEVEKYYE